MSCTPTLVTCPATTAPWSHSTGPEELLIVVAVACALRCARCNGKANATSATLAASAPQPVRTIRMILDLHEQWPSVVEQSPFPHAASVPGAVTPRQSAHGVTPA